MQAHEYGIGMLDKQAQAEQQARQQQLALIMSLPGIGDKFKDMLSMRSQPKQSDGASYNGQPPVTPENVTTYQLPSGDMSVDRIMKAIGQFESSGNYFAQGPKTRGNDRALGKYQIMASNIPQWSKAALGYEISPQQFLANPELQDQIAQHQMQKYYSKYGTPQDVASMWFSGRPSRNNFSKDVLGTSVPDYIKNMMKYL